LTSFNGILFRVDEVAPLTTLLETETYPEVTSPPKACATLVVKLNAKFR